MANGGVTATYTFTPCPEYYISSISLGLAYSSGGSSGNTEIFTVDDNNSVTVAYGQTDVQTLSATYDEDRSEPVTIVVTGANLVCATSDFNVTLKHVKDTHQVFVDNFTEYFQSNLDPYTHVAVYSETSIQTTRSAFDNLLTEYSERFPVDFSAEIDALILATPLDLATPLAVKFKGQRDTAQNNYLSIDPANPANSHTVNNGDEPALIWLLSKADGEEKVRLTHFMTGKELSNHNTANTVVGLVEAGQGFDFLIHPIKVSTDSYLVELHDGKASCSYLHEGTNNRVLKWNSVAAGSPSSGWELIVVENYSESLTTDVAYEFSLDTTDDAAMHTFTFTHESGISRAIGTSGEIVIRKITFKSTEDENEPAAVKARVAENNSYEYADVEPAATIDVDDATATDNGLILSCNRLDAGSYEMAVPEHVFMVGSGSTARLNKATKSIITVDADGGITDIDEVAAAVAPVVEGIYDLQGRKLTKPVKGINIINGRKVFVK